MDTLLQIIMGITGILKNVIKFTFCNYFMNYFMNYFIKFKIHVLKQSLQKVK